MRTIEKSELNGINNKKVETKWHEPFEWDAPIGHSIQNCILIEQNPIPSDSSTFLYARMSHRTVCVGCRQVLAARHSVIIVNINKFFVCVDFAFVSLVSFAYGFSRSKVSVTQTHGIRIDSSRSKSVCDITRSELNICEFHKRKIFY